MSFIKTYWSYLFDGVKIGKILIIPGIQIKARCSIWEVQDILESSFKPHCHTVIYWHAIAGMRLRYIKLSIWEQTQELRDMMRSNETLQDLSQNVTTPDMSWCKLTNNDWQT